MSQGCIIHSYRGNIADIWAKIREEDDYMYYEITSESRMGIMIRYGKFSTLV